MKKWWRWVRILILVYCIIGIALYYLQDYILFHPVEVTGSQPYGFTAPHKEVNIPYSTNSNINIVQFVVPDSLEKGVVLYFHGNKKKHFMVFEVLDLLHKK